MKRLEYFRAYEAGEPEDKTIQGNEPDTIDSAQNNFGGISPDGFISLFEQDVEPSKGGSVDMEGAHFTMLSTKLGLWNFQTLQCNIIGINSPFQRTDYVDYLKTLPRQAVNMLLERMEYYSLPDDGAMLFGVNDTIRILQARMENEDNLLYYVVYPGSDGIEMTTDFNNTVRGEETTGRIKNYIGIKIYSWLKTKFTNFTNQQ